MKIKRGKQLTKIILFVGIIVLLGTIALFKYYRWPLLEMESRQIKPTSYIAPFKTGEVYASQYDSQTAKLHFDLKYPMYINEQVTNKDGWVEGRIIISLFPGGNEEISNMTIVYGIPEINGKGGACPPNGYQSRIVLEQTINICEGESSLFAGYLKHPKEKIDYAIFTGGKKLTTEAYQEYKKILYSGMRFIN